MPAFKTILVALLLFVGQPVFASDLTSQQKPIDPKKAAVIHELLEVTGAANIGKQMMGQLLEIEKKAHPEVSQEVWDRLVAKLDINSMQELIVQVYDRHFSTQDLQASLTFYKSEPGQRMLKELPSAMNEAMTIGKNWGRQKAEELMKELEDEKAKENPSAQKA